MRENQKKERFFFIHNTKKEIHQEILNEVYHNYLESQGKNDSTVNKNKEAKSTFPLFVSVVDKKECVPSFIKNITI